MLQNAYLLAKIGADTAENEQHFAEICQKLATGSPVSFAARSRAATPPVARGGRAPGLAVEGEARARLLRSEVNTELNFPPNFEGLVLGCIDADFCK